VEKIVVGVDGSDASKDALRWAVAEARAHDARVVALHAWELPIAAPDITPAPRVDLTTIVSEVQAAALRLVTAALEEVLGGDSTVTVEPAAVEGPAASALIDAARDADLLVVGSRGMGGFAALVLGSVSQQCAHHAPCPVVIHRRRQASAG
jgi:nucleotide-binding universal stress UspA family protein